MLLFVRPNAISEYLSLSASPENVGMFGAEKNRDCRDCVTHSGSYDTRLYDGLITDNLQKQCRFLKRRSHVGPPGLKCQDTSCAVSIEATYQPFQ